MERWLYVSLTLYLRTALNTSELTVPILPIYSHFISMFIAGINFQLDQRVFRVKNNDDTKLLLLGRIAVLRRCSLLLQTK